MYPGKYFFRKHESEPTTSVAIRRSFAEDLYVVLAFQPSDLAAQSASLQINVNPLVDWIWLGFGVLALGTGIALMPEQVFAFSMAHVPEGVEEGWLKGLQMTVRKLEEILGSGGMTTRVVRG